METGTADDREGITSLAHSQCGEKPTRKTAETTHKNIKKKNTKGIQGFQLLVLINNNNNKSFYII